MSGATLYLADGIYAPATQGNGATIPDGVAVRASNAGAARLVDGVKLTVAGSSAIDGIVLDSAGSFCGAITATTTVGTPTLALSGVLVSAWMRSTSAAASRPRWCPARWPGVPTPPRCRTATRGSSP